MQTSPIPAGYHTITPYISLKNAKSFIDFLINSFGAELVESTIGEDGIIYNAEVRIGTSMVMVGESPESTSRFMLYLYVLNPDELYEKAIAAGAKSICPMMDQVYGDRSGGVEDIWGNQWWLAKRQKNVSPEEVAKAMAGRKKE